MSSIQAVEVEREESPDAPVIEVSGHNVMRCSACDVELIDAMVTEPEIDFTQEFRAECPYCGDRSRPVRVTGGVRLLFLKANWVGQEEREPTDPAVDYSVLLKTEKAHAHA